MPFSLETLNSTTCEWLISPSQEFFDTENSNKPSPWSNELIEVIADFSQYLLRHVDPVMNPELVALGFWCRKANLITLRSHYLNLDKKQSRQRVGGVFHVTPANVDTVFFYSLVLSVLSGNQNIIRLSSRSGFISQLLVNHLKDFLDANYQELNQFIAILRYDKVHGNITEALSSWCDLRVVWGSDQSIADIDASFPIEHQIIFPTRYAILVMHLSSMSDVDEAAVKFVADTQPFKQQGCASPKAIFWLSTSEEIQRAFCEKIEEISNNKPTRFTTSEQTARLINLQTLSLENELPVNSLSMQPQYCHVQLSNISHKALLHHQGFGLIFHQTITDVTQITITNTLQNIGVYNLPENQLMRLTDLFNKRIVKLGEALTFHYQWDGVDLLKAYTKAV